MAFSLSGSTITQTGTDTDLSGLSGIAGVTTETSGQSASEYIRYTMQAGYNLVVNGTLTLNALDEQLVMLGLNQSGAEHVVNGTFTIDGMISRGSDLVPTYAVGFLNRAVDGDCCGNQFLDIESGGLLHLRGAHIMHEGCLAINSGGTFKTTEGMLTTRKTGGTASRLRFNGGSIADINGLQTNGMPLDFGGATVTRLDGFKPNANGYGWTNFQFNTTASVAGQIQRYKNPQPLNPLSVSFNNWNNVKQLVLNSSTGTDILNGGRTANSHTVLGKEFTLNVKDAQGVNIDGAKVYIRDTDNGNRKSSANNWWSPSGTGIKTWAEDFIYEYTTDASGNIGDAEIATGVWLGGNGVNTGDTNPDLRGKTGVAGDDLFDISVLGYNQAYGALSNVSMKGNGVLDLGVALLPDTSITQSDKAVTVAYTELETSAKFYDRAKAYLVDNYAGEAETIVTRSGTTIDAGSHDIVVDATAASAFAFDGTTITIHADTFTGNITTTGSITLANGAIANGILSDASGTTGILELV